LGSISNLYARNVKSSAVQRCYESTARFRSKRSQPPPRSLEDEMLDTVLLAAGVVGLLLTVAYAYACERM
jgi:hypothetical protein